MRIILLLCAVSALTISAVPVEVPAAQEIHQVPVEVPAAQEIHQVDGELPVEIVEEVGEVKLLRKGERSRCESGWSRFRFRCFKFISNTMGWADAERFCLRLSANLASIHSTKEYDFVQEVVRVNTGRFPQAWLGGNDAVKENIWLWSDGSKFGHNDWANNAPSNTGKTCVVMNYSADLLWKDQSCDLSLPFVCARPQWTS